MTDTFEPIIVGFTCNWCSYRAADGAGSVRSRTVGFQKPADIVALLQGFSLADRAAKDH